MHPRPLPRPSFPSFFLGLVPSDILSLIYDQHPPLPHLLSLAVATWILFLDTSLPVPIDSHQPDLGAGPRSIQILRDECCDTFSFRIERVRKGHSAALDPLPYLAHARPLLYSSQNMDDGEHESLVFVLQHEGRRLSDRRKSLVKAHVARRLQERRRKNSAKTPSPPVREKSNQRVAAEGNPSPVQNSIDRRAPRKQSSTHPSASNVSPQINLLKGNTDPFATTQVVIDPVVNQLLTFYREHQIPLQHWRKADPSRGSSYANRFLQHIVNALQDGCTGYAYLSGYATIIANMTQDTAMATTALDFRSRAYAKLHERLANGWIDAPTSLSWTLYSFFASAVGCNDLAAAAVHGNALQGILQPGAAAVPARHDDRLLNALLWQDMQRAAMTLTRPIFDLEWMTLHLIAGSFFKFVWQNMAQVSSLQHTVSTSIDESIIRIFRETSYLLRLTDSHTAGNVKLAKPVIHKISARSLVLEGQLLNLYVDRTEEHPSDTESKPSTYREVCLTLAGLYWLRRAGHHEGYREKYLTSKPRRSIYETGPKIRRRIKHAMFDAGAKEMSTDPTLLLWILYVGSIIEQDQGLKSDIESNWFNRQFVAQAERMGLWHWGAVEAALAEVLYRPEISPYARRSFHRYAKAAPQDSLFSKAESVEVKVEVLEESEEKVLESQSPGGGIYRLQNLDDKDKLSSAIRLPHEGEEGSSRPGQSTSSPDPVTVREEDQVSKYLNDSIYGLFI